MPKGRVTVFSAEVSHLNGNAEVRLTGELDLASAIKLRATIADLVGPHLRAVTLDVGDLGFVDGAGFRSLEDVRRMAVAAGAEFELRSPSAFVRRVGRLSGYDDLIDGAEVRT